jgi:hypothetical protein
MNERGSDGKRLAATSALAFAWGVAWALFLQKTQVGRWLAVKMTWITVDGGQKARQQLAVVGGGRAGVHLSG